MNAPNGILDSGPINITMDTRSRDENTKINRVTTKSIVDKLRQNRHKLFGYVN